MRVAGSLVVHLDPSMAQYRSVHGVSGARRIRSNGNDIAAAFTNFRSQLDEEFAPHTFISRSSQPPLIG
jgi:hypothetical protein